MAMVSKVDSPPCPSVAPAMLAGRGCHEAMVSPLQDEEESWESSLLPPRRRLAVKAGMMAAAPASGRARVTAAALTCVEGTVPEQGRRARLLNLEMKNFKCFDERTISFEGHTCSCVVGTNSSGKSSVLDAIKFVTLRPVKHIRGLVRRCRPAVLHCCVTADFETESLGKVTLQRSLILDSPKEHSVTYAIAANGNPLKEVPESKYASWVEKALCWKDDDVIMNQFSLIEQSSVTQLLAKLPKLLDKLEAEAEVRPPMLKRQCKGVKPPNSGSCIPSVRTTAEAWVGRRLDELYCELSREPLDEHFETWGDGGQACLRRLDDGSYTIFVSQRRGLAALGFGSPLESVSDGDRDLCALALLLTLPALSRGSAGLQDVLPPLVILDEPDSRLDKRGACCLQQLLSGPRRPSQALLMSLNNHRAFKDVPGIIVLPEVVAQPWALGGTNDDDEDDPYGDARPRKRAVVTAAVAQQP